MSDPELDKPDRASGFMKAHFAELLARAAEPM